MQTRSNGQIQALLNFFTFCNDKYIIWVIRSTSLIFLLQEFDRISALSAISPVLSWQIILFFTLRRLPCLRCANVKCRPPTKENVISTVYSSMDCLTFKSPRVSPVAGGSSASGIGLKLHCTISQTNTLIHKMCSCNLLYLAIYAYFADFMTLILCLLPYLLRFIQYYSLNPI